MRLSNKAQEKIMGSNDLQLKLALKLKRHQWSIKRTARDNEENNSLTNTAAVRLIGKETGLTGNQIVTEKSIV